MVSTPSTILGLELQGTGDNINSWGTLLNALFSQVEEAGHSVVDIVVNADVTLTSTNYQSNESRRAGHRFTGAGGFTVTLPEKPRVHIMQNDCTDDVTIAVGLTTVTLEAGERDLFWTDGTTAYLMGWSTLNTTLEDYLPKSGGTLTGDLTLSGAPTSNLHAATKKYVDDVALGSVSVSYAFADITDKPTTLTGYGITDAQKIWLDDSTEGNVTCVAGTRYRVPTLSGAYTRTFPAGVDGDEIWISDTDLNASTNNITLTPNGSETIAGESSLAVDMDGFSKVFRYNSTDSNWEAL